MSEQSEPRGGLRLWMLVPAMGALMVLAVFLLGLQRDDVQRLPSVLIDKEVPAFELPPLDGHTRGLTATDLHGPGVKLVNVWASWCGPCRIEHPQIKALAAEGVTIHGLNYKDTDANAQAFLDELGNPYTLIGADRTGRTGIEFGVYGVPETFVIDASGTIVFKHVGPLMSRDMDKMRAAIAKAADG